MPSLIAVKSVLRLKVIVRILDSNYYFKVVERLVEFVIYYSSIILIVVLAKI